MYTIIWVYIITENNLIYFNLNKGDVLIFNQSLKALSDHLLIGFDMYVIQLYIVRY